jgi:hypothetical protein
MYMSAITAHQVMGHALQALSMPVYSASMSDGSLKSLDSICVTTLLPCHKCTTAVLLP